MPIVITMPRLSDTMEEGTLIKWNAAVGDKISAGDTIADIETDKATMELQAFDDGTLAKIVVNDGETAPVGSPIVVFAEDGESIEDAVANADMSGDGGAESAPADDDGGSEPAAAAAPAPAAPVAAANGGRVKVSPLARKMAEDNGLDLNQIQGSGPDGKIIKRDILDVLNGTAPTASAPAPTAAAPVAAQSAPAAPQVAPVPTSLEAKLLPVSNMRKTIAKRLVESKTTVPHFQTSVTVNMDPLLELRSTINEQLASQGVKLSINDFITKATALACLQHPHVNASWTDQGVQLHGTVNVGTAIALPIENGGGLVVASIRNVESKGLRQISSEVKALATKAREKGLTVEEMSDSTISISNLGMPQYGVTQFNAIVNPPNAAILAIAATIERPVVRTIDGQKQIVIGHEMNITLSGDHRVIDGAVSAEYLATLRNLLENPASLLV